MAYFGVANAFGLYDLHGNVWEWCKGDSPRIYEGAPKDGSAWIDPGAVEDVTRVLRGGSWFFGPRDCRSASRLHLVAGFDINDVKGFRVVCRAPRTV